MKKRTKVVIRVIGAILIILALIMGFFSFKDAVINGLEVGTVGFGLIGTYMLLASEARLLKWRIN